MTIEYNLYRAKFIRDRQASLLHDACTPEELFVKAIGQKPSAELRREYVWHIGNIVMFTDSAGRFAVGRTAKTTVAKYDDNSGNFIEESSQASPYTYVVFDAQIGLMAVAKKTMLAPETRGIASNIAKLLQRTEIVINNHIDVEIDIINDPTTFIDKLHTAYALKDFSATFTGPNPFDADEYYQKPLVV